MVRPARVEDGPVLFDLLHQFFLDGLNKMGISPDKESVCEFLAKMIDTNNHLACLFVGEVDGKVIGLIGGHVHHPWYSLKLRIATQDLWYVLPSFRGSPIGYKLLKAFEEWCERMAATIIFMPFTQFYEPEKVARMLRKAGYKHTETWFTKEVKEVK